MPEIKVDYNTILTASEDCGASGGELDAMFDQLKSDLGPLVEGWQGEAQGAWQAVQQEWDTSLEEMRQVLAKIETALVQIAESYQETEKGVTGMF